MTINPYESPQAADDSKNVTADRLHAIVVGFFGGAFVGGTAGAVQAVVLALLVLYGIVDVSMSVGDGQNNVAESSEPITVVTAAALLGGLSGIGIGCFFGPILGAVAAVFGPSSKSAIHALSIGAASLSSVVLSLLVVRFAIVAVHVSWLAFAVIAVTSAIGVGVFSGNVLARGIGRIVWQSEP